MIRYGAVISACALRGKWRQASSLLSELHAPWLGLTNVAVACGVCVVHGDAILVV